MKHLKLKNEYSINLPAVYHLKGKSRSSWINIINPFRGTLIGGSPGSGKSYFVIRHIITQHIQKCFTMLVCLANNPQKSQVYGAILSLYINRINKLVNRKNQQKFSMIFDEFPTIYFNGIDNLIATARSNKVAVTLAVQDYSQLKKDYGRDQAEVNFFDFKYFGL